uniref:Uncharacterized protein n=1 Tax=Timema shepardi TaxID=629360 RepID=A0A7R9AKN7_TIMSH|nr:unnamed protein product [Timema shepardi]
MFCVEYDMDMIASGQCELMQSGVKDKPYPDCCNVYTCSDKDYNSPMASLVLTDGFEKVTDQIMYPYAEQYDLQNMCLTAVTSDSQNLDERKALKEEDKDISQPGPSATKWPRRF